MFGFMLTLGSAGIVTQLMSGLVLIYSRALKVGDFVSIGEVTGVVKEMSVLSTKIINMRNEEVTIPNAVLVNNPIKNFTGAVGERGTLISTTVTIGYDTPWRQVHAMLINAAEHTSGLRTEPKPFVIQKALQDFYVEYELYAYVDRPLERIQILSELHSRIQDEFNTYGVQIMSPNFVLQPRNNVVVNKDKLVRRAGGTACTAGLGEGGAECSCRLRLSGVGLVQALTGAGCAVSAVAGDAEVAAQVFQRAGAAFGGFANLAIGDGLADTNVHRQPP